MTYRFRHFLLVLPGDRVNCHDTDNKFIGSVDITRRQTITHFTVERNVLRVGCDHTILGDS